MFINRFFSLFGQKTSVIQKLKFHYVFNSVRNFQDRFKIVPEI